LIFALFCLNLNISYCQTIIPEQCALNYFVENIWKSEFSWINKIYYSGTTDSLNTCIGLNVCYLKNNSFSNKDTMQIIASRIDPSLANSFSIPHTYSKPIHLFNSKLLIESNTVSKKHNRRSAVLTVYNGIRIRNNFYVTICIGYQPGIYKTIEFELNKSCQILHYCID
jgi:hypothetical protein